MRKRIKHRERCKLVKFVTPSGVTDFTILHLSWCWTLYIQHEQIMSPLRRRQTYCFFLLWFFVMFSYNFVPVVTFFIFWYRFMIFSMKVSDHPPVCDILSRPSSGLVHQGQILFDFWGHFCVRNIAFFSFHIDLWSWAWGWITIKQWVSYQHALHWTLIFDFKVKIIDATLDLSYHI